MKIRTSRLLPIALTLSLGLAFGCDPSGAADDDDDQYVGATPTDPPTATEPPTPEATEVPTPDPYVGYRISQLIVEDSNGVDLDEDGQIENDYADTLEELAKAVAAGFVDQCVEILSNPNLPEQVPNDNPTATCRAASAGVQKAFAELVNLDSMNANIAEALTEPTVVYLSQFEPRGSGNINMIYYWGEAEATYFYLGDTISIHSGSIDEFGNAKLGPGAFPIAMKLVGPVVSYMNLTNARTEVHYKVAEGISNARLGGVLTEADLVALLVESIASVAPLPEPVLNQLGQAVADLIPDCGTSGTVMADCDDLGGIAMGLTFTAGAVEVY